MQKKSNTPSCVPDIYDIEYLVCHVGLLWRRLLNNKIKALGISGTDKRVLFCIAHNPKLTQVQIATLLDLEPQNLMRTLDKLEKQGFIVKENDPQDRRAKCLSLTANAKKIIAKIKAISEDIKPMVLSGINASDLEKVRMHLAKMRENICSQLDEDIDTSKIPVKKC